MKVIRKLLILTCISGSLFFYFFVQNANAQSKKNGEIYNPDGIEMVFVEISGKFKGFFIGRYEVTQAQWKAIMGNNPSRFKGDSLPVEHVSWNDVQEFLNRLNNKTGNNYRLPTVAEWEYAAKGGSNKDTYKYSGSDNIDEVAWYWENSGYDKTHIVGTKKPNSLGIYDMSGNVWEHCEDLLDSKDSIRAGRGGSWNSQASYCCINYIDDSCCNSNDRSSNTGFRVVLSYYPLNLQHDFNK